MVADGVEPQGLGVADQLAEELGRPVAVSYLAAARPRVAEAVSAARAGLADGGRGVVANYLLASGVRVYFYPGMTHVKALLADGWACVGSGNYNHLSMRVNHEQNVATADPEFVGEVRARLFEADFERSLELQEPLNVDWLDVVTNVLLEGP